MENHADIFILNIENDTVVNNYYRRVLYTSQHMQLVIQTIKPKSDINFEVHPDNDQFIRVEKGIGMLLVGRNKESKYMLKDGVAMIIPAGTWHQVLNTSSTENLHLYTIYTPPHHPRDTVEKDRPVTPCTINEPNDSASLVNNTNTANTTTVTNTNAELTTDDQLGSFNYRKFFYDYNLMY